MDRPTPRRPHRARALALAFACALALSIPAVQAQAADNAPADPGVRCAAKTGPGQYEFYLPGEKVTDANGNKWVCGPDGMWFRDYSAALTTFPTFTRTVGRTALVSLTTAYALR